jgi:hypothetical protein
LSKGLPPLDGSLLVGAGLYEELTGLAKPPPPVSGCLATGPFNILSMIFCKGSAIDSAPIHLHRYLTTKKITAVKPSCPKGYLRKR